ncbi:MAG: hypothetical protein FWG71_03665 [Synergistaceae bacterium]|nr:hypothetical protein [Synergistaceae bacterium]
MTKTAFRNDFLRGLGSALIELRSRADPDKFRDVVLYGCTHNTTYDMQCEGDRGWYLHQAAKLSGNETAVEEAVRKKFFNTGKDSRLFGQLTSILYHFAEDGGEPSQNARNAIYRQYENMLNELSRKRKFGQQLCHRRDMFDWLCVWLTSLDGWRAFKKIVGDVGKFLLPKDVDFFFSEWFYDNSKGKFGKKRVELYLQKQSAKSPHIRVYYEKAKGWDRHIYETPPIPTLDEVLSAAKGPLRVHGLAMRFAHNASPEDLEKLALAAMNEPDAGIQIALLWAFRHNGKYTFPEDFLSRLSQSGDERLRGLAYEIIGQNPSPKMRELALSLIQSGKDIENGVSLLVKNLLPEDEGLLYDSVKSFPTHINKTDWHGVFMDAERGMESLRNKPKTNILEYLYRNTLCGSCREWIVKAMREKKVLSDEILNECLFDANSDIRAFAGRLRPTGQASTRL